MPRATDRRAPATRGAGRRSHCSACASGLNNAAFQIGGALGAAVVTRVAVSQTDGSSLAAPTHGFQSAFAAAAAFAAIGCVAAIVLLGRPRRQKAGRGASPARSTA